jgi:tetratricopeptide (TPR) repeat protein
MAAFEAANRVEADYFRTEGIPPAYDWHHEHNLDLLASSYRYLGQMVSARRRLQEAFALPSALIVQMYNKRAWPEFLIARGQFDEALVAADILSAHQSSLVRATGHIEAGLALFAKGRVQAAVERSNLALRDMRAAADGQALLLPALQQLQGQIFLRTGQREKGRAMLQALSRALQALTGPDNWVQALFTIDALARGAREADDWELAESLARQLIAQDPNYAGGHYALALVLEHAGDGPGARGEFAAAGRAWEQADAGLPELARTGTVRPSKED